MRFFILLFLCSQIYSQAWATNPTPAPTPQATPTPFATTNAQGLTLALGDLVCFWTTDSHGASISRTAQVTSAGTYPIILTFPDGSKIELGQAIEHAVLQNVSPAAK